MLQIRILIRKTAKQDTESSREKIIQSLRHTIRRVNPAGEKRFTLPPKASATHPRRKRHFRDQAHGNDRVARNTMMQKQWKQKTTNFLAPTSRQAPLFFPGSPLGRSPHWSAKSTATHHSISSRTYAILRENSEVKGYTEKCFHVITLK